MNLVKKWSSLSKMWKILSIAIPSVVIIGAIVLIIVLSNGLTATTMRLLRVEGTVTLEDAAGAQREIVNSMRFDSGDAISTGAASLASIQLDDHKIVTLEENSRAEFTKARNMLELNLTSGGLFFDVNQPLAEDESFDIRTATMTVGIRGTSGYISVDSEGIATLILTSGHVHITGVNPTTGETKQLDVNPGYQVRVFLFNNRTVGSVDFVLEEITEDMLNQFILQRLGEDKTLRLTVCAACGWSEDLILELGGFSVEVDETEETEESETSEETTTATTTSETEETTTSASTSATEAAAGNGGGGVTNTPTPTATATPTPRATSTPTPRPSHTPTPTQAPSNGGSGNSGSGTNETTPTPAPSNPTTTTPTPRVPTTSPTRPTQTEPTGTSEPTSDPSSNPSIPTQDTDPTEDTDPQGGETDPQGGETDPQGGETDPQGGETDPQSGDDVGQPVDGNYSANNGGTNPGGVITG